MKKIILLMLMGCFWRFSYAQDLGDAVRFNGEDLNGTARYVGMSGAFGALGGDISALKVNPAGSAIFNSNQFSFSADIDAFKNSTDFGDGHDSYRNNDFDMNQAGIVFVFKNFDVSAPVSRLSFGVTYNRTQNFKNRFYAGGRTNETVGDYILDLAQGVPLDLFTTQGNETADDLYAYLGSTDFSAQGFNNNALQTAYLGYETFLFDAVDGNDMSNTSYVSNISGNSFDHAYLSSERGLKGKVSLNGGMALWDRIYLGLNLNAHFIDYRKNTILNEFIDAPSEINEVDFGNYLDTRGSGFSFQVGGIAKLTEVFRLGVSYESPTWYSILDHTNQFMRTDSDEFDAAVLAPEVTNVFPRYHMRSPGKITGSVAAVLENNSSSSGILSFDYSYQDYGETKFTSRGFEALNENIKDFLQEVNTYRLGGEYRYKNLSFRGGFRYQDSPYVDHTIGDLRGYSAGLGYQFGNFRIDFAYDYAERNYNAPMEHTGFTDRIAVKNNMNHYVLTATFML